MIALHLHRYDMSKVLSKGYAAPPIQYAAFVLHHEIKLKEFWSSLAGSAADYE